MLLTIAAVALSLQTSLPIPSGIQSSPSIQQVQYGVPRHPPPCGHGWDLRTRDGMCYPNGYLPPQEQEARTRYYRGYDYYPRPRRHYRSYWDD